MNITQSLMTGMNKPFLVKATLVTLLTVTTVYSCSQHYMIGVDPQKKIKSSPFTVFLIDKKNHALAYNQYIAFHIKGAEPYFKEGTLFAKKVVGMAGDQVTIKNGYQSINGQGHKFVHLHKTLKKNPEDFDVDLTLPDGQIWVNGTTPYSLDSRYLGPVSMEQVVGRAYPLW